MDFYWCKFALAGLNIQDLNRSFTFLKFIIAAGFLLFTSCEYKPDGENFKDITKPDESKVIQVQLLPYDTTYVIWSPVMLSYIINTFGLSIYNIRVLIDDLTIYEGIKSEDSFYFNPGSFEEGQKTLSLAVTTGTGTGSLSDLLQYEGMIFIKRWQILTYGCCPDQVKITRILAEDGILKMEWEINDQPGFQKYRIYVHYTELDQPDYPHIVAEFTDPLHNWCYDSAYIGGVAKYWVEVVARNQYAGGPITEINYPFPKLEVLWQAGDSALLYWDRTPFYNVVSRYEISTSIPYSHTVFSSSDKNDTTCILRGLINGTSPELTLSIRTEKSYPGFFGYANTTSSLTLNIEKKTSYISSSEEKWDFPTFIGKRKLDFSFNVINH